MSNIEWTSRTWNPTTGCSRKSPGCEHCYAEKMTKRLAAMGQEKYQGLLNEQGRFNGVLKFSDDDLLKPLSVKKPTTWFVNSMSDLFHEKMPDEWIDKVFAVMALCPQHTFQILTKRAERMRDYIQRRFTSTDGFCESFDDWCYEQILRIYGKSEFGEIAFFDYSDNEQVNQKVELLKDKFKSNWLPDDYSTPILWQFYLPNVWLGVSVENKKEKHRLDTIREVPAALLFVSFEPLLEDLGNLDLSGFGWAIFGGESGAGARRCDIDWIQNGIRQCREQGVKPFVKQLGANSIYRVNSEMGRQLSAIQRPLLDRKGGDIEEFPLDLRIREIPEVKR